METFRVCVVQSMGGVQLSSDGGPLRSMCPPPPPSIDDLMFTALQNRGQEEEILT